ncbi:MAG: 5'-nucleotidase/UDP-sugar diphosphatase [Myxococcota bacterium]|jgi:5'-nucleotidase/UDP-sugar diphosphatase
MSWRRLPLFGLLLLVGCSAGPDVRRIVLFHTSDVHGAVSATPARWNKADPKRRIGGYPALASLVDSETLPHAVLDSGDIFQGTPEGNLTRGKVIIAAMNAVGYSAMAIGNHEFDYGEGVLRDLIEQAEFPVLAANIVRRSDGKHVSYAQPTTMVTVGGVRIGIVGLATQHTATSTLPANVAHLRFESEVEAAREHAARLRTEGADVVIALTHCGLLPSKARTIVNAADVVLTKRDLAYVGDLTIARGAPVDVVMGGHTHTGIDGTWRDEQSGVYIIQSHESLKATSRVELAVDVAEDRDVAANRLISLESRLVYLWPDEVGEKHEVTTVIRGYSDAIAGQLNQIVGTLADDRMKRTGTLDHPLGSWMADTMRAAAGADIGIQNTFGVRADLYQGPVKMADLYRVMPFDNTLVTVTLPGSAVLELLRDNLKTSPARVQVSGLTVSFSRGADGTVGRVEVSVGGEALVDSRLYTLATNNYMASGGSGGRALGGFPQLDSGEGLRELFVEALGLGSPLTAPGVGRIRVLE